MIFSILRSLKGQWACILGWHKTVKQRGATDSGEAELMVANSQMELNLQQQSEKKLKSMISKYIYGLYKL